MTTLTTKLKIAAWEESPTQEYDDGSKLAHAEVTLAEGSDGLTDGRSQSDLFYRPDGTSASPPSCA